VSAETIQGRHSREKTFPDRLQTTGQRAEFAVAAIIQFLDGKVAHEHLYWDQAALPFQMGILDHPLAAAGADRAPRLLKLL